MDDVRWRWVAARVREHLAHDNDRLWMDALRRSGMVVSGRTTMQGDGPLQYVLRAVSHDGITVESGPWPSFDAAFHELVSRVVARFDQDVGRAHPDDR